MKLFLLIRTLSLSRTHCSGEDRQVFHVFLSHDVLQATVDKQLRNCEAAAVKTLARVDTVGDVAAASGSDTGGAGFGGIGAALSAGSGMGSTSLAALSSVHWNEAAEDAQRQYAF